ncbi:hypothetical protein AVEN_40242-1 [Araneus ventricosus]|uniref:Uncharacterized protein n=1 Tax=Araneus ventricosus TaxID=182803 RepID=A0A4Y2JCK8_ARAVE|nr:hypothetical protein AVEN_40242-1 [Araneus ventricosus]
MKVPFEHELASDWKYDKRKISDDACQKAYLSAIFWLGEDIDPEGTLIRPCSLKIFDLEMPKSLHEDALLLLVMSSAEYRKQTVHLGTSDDIPSIY